MSSTDNTPKDIVFMKVGPHGGESLDDIVSRKVEEERTAGMAFWGYGGTLCDPIKQVRPFVLSRCGQPPVCKLLMYATPSGLTPSEHLVQWMRSTQAREFSLDKENWVSLPSGISVTGSKCAIVCKNIQLVQGRLNLSRFIVSSGCRKGWTLTDYIRGRVDKACAKAIDGAIAPSDSEYLTYYVADIVAPYAVKLR